MNLSSQYEALTDGIV